MATRALDTDYILDCCERQRGRFEVRCSQASPTLPPVWETKFEAFSDGFQSYGATGCSRSQAIQRLAQKLWDQYQDDPGKDPFE